MTSSKKHPVGFTLLGVLAVLIVGLGYYWRPLAIIHAPLWALIVKYPTLWIYSNAAGIVVALPFAVVGTVRFRNAKRQQAAADAEAEAEAEKAPLKHLSYTYRDNYDYEKRPRTPGTRLLYAAAIAWFVVGLATTIFTGVMLKHWMADATYKHYSYTVIKQLPQAGEVRIVPADVADNAVNSTYQSSGHTLRNGEIVFDQRTHKLVWSFEQAPHGFTNSYFGNSNGVVELSAEDTEHGYQQTDRKMKFGPSMSISDGLNWQFRKRHYFGVPTAPVAIVTQQGEPEYLLPWITYKGFPVKYPALGGVMVFHPNGRIEDLSSSEAAKRPEIVASGRIVPAGLAREIQNAYAYKLGISNEMFGHKDQTQINDSSDSENHWPYLMAFRDRHAPNGQRLMWVSVAEPWGRAQAANAIFLTDAITGKTEVWRAPKNRQGDEQPLIGPNRAVQLVKSQPIAGITWQNSAGSAGNYIAVEPRPVFINGHLRYLISVVAAENAQRVVKSIIVDAERAEIIAVFNHDSDPTADSKLVHYLRTGELDPSAYVSPNEIGQGTGSTSTPSGNGQQTTPPLPAPSGSLAKQISDAQQQAAQLQAKLARIQQEVAALEAKKGK